jgi:hypothetical protein
LQSDNSFPYTGEATSTSGLDNSPSSDASAQAETQDPAATPEASSASLETNNELDEPVKTPGEQLDYNELQTTPDNPNYIAGANGSLGIQNFALNATEPATIMNNIVENDIDEFDEQIQFAIPEVEHQDDTSSETDDHEELESASVNETEAKQSENSILDDDSSDESEDDDDKRGKGKGHGRNARILQDMRGVFNCVFFNP